MTSCVKLEGAGSKADGFSWGRVFLEWEHLENDLHERYGIDLGEPEPWAKPWPWFRSRVLGLLSIPPVYAEVGNGLLTVQQSRLGVALEPPKHTPHKKSKSKE